MEELSFLCKLKPNAHFFIQQSLSIAFCVLNTVLSLYYSRIKKRNSQTRQSLSPRNFQAKVEYKETDQYHSVFWGGVG